MAEKKDGGSGQRDNRGGGDRGNYNNGQRDSTKKSENTVSFDKPIPPDGPKKG